MLRFEIWIVLILVISVSCYRFLRKSLDFESDVKGFLSASLTYELLVILMLGLLLNELESFSSGNGSMGRGIILLLLLMGSHYLPSIVCFSTSSFEEPVQDTDQDSKERLREGLFDFADGTVKEAMVPINDVFKVSEDLDLMGILHHDEFTPYSRIPVFRGDKGNIIGIVYSKNLIGGALDICENSDSIESSDQNLFSCKIKKYVRDAYYVPELMSQLVLMQEFQKRMIQMAIVVDEFGVITGIVTLEDLMETIVGDVQDRRNDDESLLHEFEEKQWVFDAKIDLDDVEEIIEFEFAGAVEVETLGGYVFQHFGHLPEEGDCLKIEDLEFTVLERENYRLRKISVRKVLS